MLKRFIAPWCLLVGATLLAQSGSHTMIINNLAELKPQTPAELRCDTASRIEVHSPWVSGSTFNNMPNLEEIEFVGPIYHIDGYLFENCPKLRTITFTGPLMSTGGSKVADGCPELTSIVFNGLALSYYLTDAAESPKYTGVVKNGCNVDADSPEEVRAYLATDQGRSQLQACARGYIDCCNEYMAQWGYRSFAVQYAKPIADDICKLLDMAGMTALRDSVVTACYSIPDIDSQKPEETYLEVLAKSNPYAENTEQCPAVSYAAPTDSMLTLTRQYFNLDSVAGSGDDVSRIKRLTYFVHDLVRHDGSSQWPDCPFNARALTQVCREQNRGVNCRFMAIMLTECLLAEGIPARYLTCQSREWDTDGDCHVICVAWSRELNKWVWCDPTFAAFVSDENGLPLHPGEVRYRLQHSLPLVLNDDANWNHEQPQTVDDYLGRYMAKNLYYITCNLVNCAEPEGNRQTYPHQRGSHMALIPVESTFTGASVLTSDEAGFWRAPSAK
jgi:hypothetical protein